MAIKAGSTNPSETDRTAVNSNAKRANGFVVKYFCIVTSGIPIELAMSTICAKQAHVYLTVLTKSIQFRLDFNFEV